MHFRKKRQCKVLDLLEIDFIPIIVIVISILYRITFLVFGHW